MSRITISPAEAARKWATHLQGATEDMRRGIEAVEIAPTELAARAQDKYLAGVQRAVSTGKFASRCREVSLSDWVDAAINKGLARVGEGAEQAVPKMDAFFGKLFPYEERLAAEVAKMPSRTIDDSIARAGAWIRGMSAFGSA